jgi:hypothetical protein
MENIASHIRRKLLFFAFGAQSTISLNGKPRESTISLILRDEIVFIIWSVSQKSVAVRPSQASQR